MPVSRRKYTRNKVPPKPKAKTPLPRARNAKAVRFITPRNNKFVAASAMSSSASNSYGSNKEIREVRQFFFDWKTNDALVQHKFVDGTFMSTSADNKTAGRNFMRLIKADIYVIPNFGNDSSNTAFICQTAVAASRPDFEQYATSDSQTVDTGYVGVAAAVVEPTWIGEWHKVNSIDYTKAYTGGTSPFVVDAGGGSGDSYSTAVCSVSCVNVDTAVKFGHNVQFRVDLEVGVPVAIENRMNVGTKDTTNWIDMPDIPVWSEVPVIVKLKGISDSF